MDDSNCFRFADVTYVRTELESERLMRLSNQCADAAAMLLERGAWDDSPTLAPLLDASDALATQAARWKQLEQIAGVPGAYDAIFTATSATL